MGKEYEQLVEIKFKWTIKCFILTNNLKMQVKTNHIPYLALGKTMITSRPEHGERAMTLHYWL